VVVAIWEVLAMAPARVPAMDRMMETERVLVRWTMGYYWDTHC